MFNKYFAIAALLCAFQLPIAAFSTPGHTLTIVGTLKSFDDNHAEIQTDKGIALVPSSAVKNKGYRTGQKITAYVDIVDFARMNKAAFESKK